MPMVPPLTMLPRSTRDVGLPADNRYCVADSILLNSSASLDFSVFLLEASVGA
jgi:hypothetical protein